MISAGDVIRIGDDGSPGCHHFVVISDPAVDPQAILLVPFTTSEPWKDDTCQVSPADGLPFVRHQTCLDYYNARTESDATLMKMFSAGAAKHVMSVGAELLQRIRKGADESPRLQNKHWRLLNDQNLV